jgi:hypothetical protein
MLIFTISNSFAGVGSLSGMGDMAKKMDLKQCQTKIKELCGKEEAFENVIKCIKSHKKEIPEHCLKQGPKFDK